MVRLWWPLGSAQVANLKLWQWPQYLAMFGLGILSVRRGWLAPVPDRLRRGCGLAALAATLAFPLVVLGATGWGAGRPGVVPGRLALAGRAAAGGEGVLAVGASLWLLGLAQRPAGPRGRLARALARSVYGAFVVQGPVLIALALALRQLAVPAEGKALAVAAAGIAGSFALAWLLVTRTVLGRML